MKKRQMTGLVTGLICACIVCGGVQIGYASSVQNTEPTVTGEVSMSPYAVSLVTIAFEKKSSTQAYATVDGCSTNPKTPHIKSRITLQEAPKGSTSFVNTTQVSNKTVPEPTIFHTSFFAITSNKDYRIKVELTDVINEIETTATYYVTMK